MSLGSGNRFEGFQHGDGCPRDEDAFKGFEVGFRSGHHEFGGNKGSEFGGVFDEIIQGLGDVIIPPKSNSMILVFGGFGERGPITERIGFSLAS